MPAIKPSIRPPAQPVHDIVADLLLIEPIQEHFRLAVWHEISISVWNENEPRRAQRPDAAETDLHAREFLCLVPKNSALVEMPVVLGAFEHHDPVAQLRFP